MSTVYTRFFVHAAGDYDDLEGKAPGSRGKINSDETMKHALDKIDAAAKI